MFCSEVPGPGWAFFLIFFDVDKTGIYNKDTEIKAIDADITIWRNGGQRWVTASYIQIQILWPSSCQFQGVLDVYSKSDFKYTEVHLMI